MFQFLSVRRLCLRFAALKATPVSSASFSPFFGRVDVAVATGVHYLLNVLSTSILFLIAKVISIVMRLIMVPKCYLKHSKRSQTARSDYSASRSSNTRSLFDVVSPGIVPK